MIEFVVKRSQWLRGEGANGSYLLRDSDQKMCCLGFLGLTCGVGEENILGIKTLEELHIQDLLPESLRLLVKFHSGSFTKMMGINDSTLISDEDREKELTSLFESLNIKVTFED